MYAAFAVGAQAESRTLPLKRPGETSLPRFWSSLGLPGSSFCNRLLSGGLALLTVCFLRVWLSLTGGFLGASFP